MKKFFARLLMMFSLITLSWALLTVLVFALVETPVTSYNAAAIDKKARLMSLDEPKIILVAGSNFAFGLDSQRIETETGYPTVNLGLHAGLGYRFYTEMAKDNLNPGDVIVIGLEYDLYNGSTDTESILHTLEIDYTLASDLDSGLWVSTLGALPEYTFNRAINTLMGKRLVYEGIYSRANFNAYGDVIASRPENIMNNAAYDEIITISPELVDAKFIAYFKQYLKEVTKAGATVVFSFPVLNERNLDPDSDLQGYLSALSSIGIPIISDLNDYVMADDYFFDTHYHLNDIGVQIRTAQLISDLKATILKP